MSNPIITRLSIHRCDGAGDPFLTKDIRDKAAVESNLNGLVVLAAALTLQWNTAVSFRLMHHAIGEHKAIEEIEISLHQQNGAKFIHLDDALGLFQHTRESLGPE